MVMTGVRTFTVEIGLVDQTPPQAIAKQRARGLLKRVPRKKRLAAVELAHWGYGSLGGAGFGMLPDTVRRRAWSGPLYGLLAWIGFELGIAPLLGYTRPRSPRSIERVFLAADHLLYGLVLSDTRRPGRE